MKEVVQKAYKVLFGKELALKVVVRFSNRLRPYNAMVRKSVSVIDFHLSSRWKEVSPEIIAGVLQHLMARLWKVRKRTVSMEMYDTFMRQLGEFAPKIESDPLLAESFARVNALLFDLPLQSCNVRWGSHATTKLGHYEYATDTITISSAFKEAPQNFLDLIMYHEMLHKKHKFSSSARRTLHHSAAFKRDEKRFPEKERVEKAMQVYLRKI